jgi:hypothetical protein
MWEVLVKLCSVVSPYRDLLNVLLGSLISVPVSLWASRRVSEEYFKKQRAIDRAKEKAEVLLRFNKLVRAFKKWQTEMPGQSKQRAFPDYVKDAMDEYKTYHDIYLPEGDVMSSYRQAAIIARKEIQKELESASTDPDMLWDPEGNPKS